MKILKTLIRPAMIFVPLALGMCFPQADALNFMIRYCLMIMLFVVFLKLDLHELKLYRSHFLLTAANLLIGGLFAFSFSMLEVSDSLILVQKSVFYPITKAIFELSQVLGPGAVTASAFGVWTMIFMGAALGAASVILGKKLGALFRF